MFDFVRTHMKLMQLLLLLLIFPSFVFFGVQGYTTFTEGYRTRVASIDGQPIAQAEWDALHQRQVERVRRQNPTMDAKLLDTPAARQETLTQIVRERVLQVAARDLHLGVSDERLQRMFTTDPQFAPLRNPDGSVNKDVLASQGMSSEGFAQQLRQDLGQQQVLRGILVSGLASPAAADAALDPLLQQRELAYTRFETRDYLPRMQPTDADLAAFHKAHEGEFRTTEQAKIEYVEIDLDSLKKDLTVPEEDLRRYYAENASRYTAAEERRARHILIKADKGAPADVRAKAKSQAEALLAEVRKAPLSFPDVAKKNSQDEGSAAQGGDLDFFARGAMVKPFEDAVFAMKPGEISNLIETEFGYHIIKLEALRGGERKSFEELRATIDDEVRKQLAGKRWAEAAEQFSNMVYEQADSLQPVADKLKLAKRSATVQRLPAPDTKGALASAKLLESVFGKEALSNKRNTEAVEVGPNHLAAARVVEYQPARARPLDEVRDQVRQRVVAEQAAAAARKDGEALLAELKKTPQTALKNKATVSRTKPENLPRAALDAVLRADASKLPAPLGVDLGAAGYLVARVEKVLPRERKPDEDKMLLGQWQQTQTQAEALAYYESLKTRYKVSMNPPPAPDAAASTPTR